MAAAFVKLQRVHRLGVTRDIKLLEFETREEAEADTNPGEILTVFEGRKIVKEFRDAKVKAE